MVDNSGEILAQSKTNYGVTNVNARLVDAGEIAPKVSSIQNDSQPRPSKLGIKTQLHLFYKNQ